MPKTNIVVNLSGQDGNIFNILGRVTKKLKQAGHKEYAKTLTKEVTSAKSYDEALLIIMNYVEVD